MGNGVVLDGASRCNIAILARHLMRRFQVAQNWRIRFPYHTADMIAILGLATALNVADQPTKLSYVKQHQQRPQEGNCDGLSIRHGSRQPLCCAKTVGGIVLPLPSLPSNLLDSHSTWAIVLLLFAYLAHLAFQSCRFGTKHYHPLRVRSFVRPPARARACGNRDASWTDELNANCLWPDMHDHPNCNIAIPAPPHYFPRHSCRSLVAS